MLINPASNLRTIAVSLGSLSSDVTIPVSRLAKKARIMAVRLMNGANIAAGDADNKVAISLKNGNAVVASLDTSSQGAISKNVALDFALDAAESLVAAGTDLTCKYDETEDGSAEVTRIVCRADSGGDLSGTGFIIYDEIGSVGVYFDNGNAGATAPTDVNAAARKIEVNSQSDDDTVQDIVIALAAKLDADAKFVAVVDPDDDTAVLVTSSTAGQRTDAVDSADAATDFVISVDNQGVDVVVAALTNAQLIIDYYPL